MGETNLLYKTISKLLSGRFFVVIATCITYSFVVVYTTIKYVSSVNPIKLEGFAVGLIMGFSGLAGFIYKSYYDRERTKNMPEPPPSE